MSSAEPRSSSSSLCGPCSSPGPSRGSNASASGLRVAVAGGDLPEAAADPPLTGGAPLRRVAAAGRPCHDRRHGHHRHLSRRQLRPVSEEITATELAVTGTIPAELDGRLIRNGPNPIDGGHPDAHWFTGTAWCTACGCATGGPTGIATATSSRTESPKRPAGRSRQARASTTPRAPPTPT